MFLSPRKHKEINSSSSFAKDIAKHITKAARSLLSETVLSTWDDSKISLKQKNSRKEWNFLRELYPAKDHFSISILKDKTLSS